jgi:hypothetical protein
VSGTPAQYSGQLALFSEQIVQAVHDEGPDELLTWIDRSLRLATPPGVNPVVALVTTLAAQVNPHVSLERRLEWVQGFDPASSAPTGRPELLARIEEAAA